MDKEDISITGSRTGDNVAITAGILAWLFMSYYGFSEEIGRHGWSFRGLLVGVIYSVLMFIGCMVFSFIFVGAIRTMLRGG